MDDKTDKKLGINYNKFYLKFSEDYAINNYIKIKKQTNMKLSIITWVILFCAISNILIGVYIKDINYIILGTQFISNSFLIEILRRLNKI